MIGEKLMESKKFQQEHGQELARESMAGRRSAVLRNPWRQT